MGQSSSRLPCTMNFGLVVSSVFAKRVAVARDGRCDADEHRHARILRADLHGDPRSERKPRGPERRRGIARVHVIEGRAEIGLLAGALVEHASAGTHAAKIEAHHRAADARETLRALEHRFGVHRPALLRMRVGKDDGRTRRLAVAVDHHLEWPGRTGDGVAHVSLPCRPRTPWPPARGPRRTRSRAPRARAAARSRPDGPCARASCDERRE